MTAHTTRIESKLARERQPAAGTAHRWVCSCKRFGEWELLRANAEFGADLHVRRVTHDGPCHRCGEQTVAVEAARKITKVEAEPSDGGWWVAVDGGGNTLGRPLQVGDRALHGLDVDDADAPRHHLHDCRHTPAHKRMMERARG